MDDYFSVPLGYTAPGEEEDGASASPVPSEAYDHPGKWLALHGGQVMTVKDTEAELREELGDRRLGVTFFYVPTTALYAL